MKKGDTELQSVLNIGLRDLILSGQMNTIVSKYLQGGRYEEDIHGADVVIIGASFPLPPVGAKNTAA